MLFESHNAFLMYSPGPVFELTA